MDILLHPTFINEVAKQISISIKRKLSKIELEHLVQYIRDLNPSVFNRKTPKELSSILSQNYIKRLNSSRKHYDIHEITKGNLKDSVDYIYSTDCGEYSVSDNLSLTFDKDMGDNTSLRDFSTKIPLKSPSVVTTENDIKKIQPIQNIYLLLDSKYRNLSTDYSVYKWVVNNNSNTTQGSVNTLSSNIKNIINIQFCGIQIPYCPSADNIYKKISLFIEEFSSMSILAHPNIRYHMLFDTKIITNRIDLQPVSNDDGYFRFYKPLNILDSMTIIFRSPFSNITFLKDRYNVIITPGIITTITFSEPHNITDGELIHIEEYNTLSNNIDIVQINQINIDTGHIVTYVDNTNLSININTSTVTPDINNSPTVFVASRRILIPLRLEYLV